MGAVIVDPEHQHIVSHGYNGSAPGADHCDDVGCDDSTGHCIRTVHGEANALAYAARVGVSVEGCTVYLTHTPCRLCAQLLAAAGIARVVWLDAYRSDDGVWYLSEQGVEVDGPSVTRGGFGRFYSSKWSDAHA